MADLLIQEKARQGDRSALSPIPGAVPPKTKTAYLPTLDGWRAIAVALVLACHAVGPSSTWRDASGALGVSIFFGISGYLICTRLLEERLRSGRISLRKFYIRRAFRILPPAFAYLAFVAVLMLAGVIKVSYRELAASAFFFRNYTPGNWYTSHFWSLAVEEHFYFFFPALLIVVGNQRTKWVALAISVATAIWRYVDSHYGLLTTHLPEGVYSAARTDFRLDGLMLGCFAAIALHQRTPNVPRWIMTILAPASALILVANMFHIVPVPEFLKATVIVVMLVSTVLSPSARLGRILELAPIRWIGRLSYSLYLWQQMFFVKYEPNQAEAFRLLQSPPYNLAMVFLVAALSYYFLERPMIKFGLRFGKSSVPGRA
jgi:peptidoglycan/LPS O-acetylase OafA/YrhL